MLVPSDWAPQTYWWWWIRQDEPLCSGVLAPYQQVRCWDRQSLYDALLTFVRICALMLSLFRCLRRYRCCSSRGQFHPCRSSHHQWAISLIICKFYRIIRSLLWHRDMAIKRKQLKAKDSALWDACTDHQWCSHPFSPPGGDPSGSKPRSRSFLMSLRGPVLLNVKWWTTNNILTSVPLFSRWEKGSRWSSLVPVNTKIFLLIPGEDGRSCSLCALLNLFLAS